MDRDLDSQPPPLKIPGFAVMPPAIHSQFVSTVGRDMAGFNVLQRNALRFPVRQKPATDADVMQSRLD